MSNSQAQDAEETIKASIVVSFILYRLRMLRNIIRGGIFQDYEVHL
ncbi:MAG: hypothetical protein ACTSV2_05175 [Candidatus Thorarchaeota archaeon]